MTTNSASPKPNDSQQRLKVAAIVTIAILAILCLVLVVNLVSKNRTAKELTFELSETEQLKADLEKQYYEALSELEEMRGSNEELNALIETQKGELTQQKEKIEALLRDSRNLDKARSELKTLKAQVEQYLAEINQLREENAQLTEQNTYLTDENSNLQTNLDSARYANQELSAAKASLVSVNEQLEQERSVLSKKVNVASVIKVNNLEATGLKLKGTGKATEKKYAKNVEQLQVCFTTTANEVAEQGVEVFHVRIINPLGETMAVEGLGSGVFTNNKTGDQVRYTKAKEVDYDQKTQDLCIVWAPNQPFQEGNYEIEVYNKGYLAGATTLSLK
ncbi:MAG TPA: hypothetical protein PKA00_11515 [Saprospiraceae bacterium]|nr:hypothetical protein [Saprospiraceae bacterium]HMQ83531.1 hypothetical protein [Saprospiraceae bacterium]